MTRESGQWCKTKKEKVAVYCVLNISTYYLFLCVDIPLVECEILNIDYYGVKDICSCA